MIILEERCMMSNEIAVLSKAVEVLRFMKSEPFEFSALEISDAININRTTVHRILNTLMQTGMIHKVEGKNVYRIGYLAFEIGMTYKNILDPGSDIRNVLRDLGRELKINVSYNIKREMKVISIHEINEFTQVKFGYTEGSEYPLVRGVTGKTVMAFHEPFSEVETIILNTDLVKKTSQTPMEHSQIISDLREIKSQGYGLSIGENILGFIGVAAPVFLGGKIHGCVAVAAVREGLKEEDIDGIIRSVRDTADKISMILS